MDFSSNPLFLQIFYDIQLRFLIISILSHLLEQHLNNKILKHKECLVTAVLQDVQKFGFNLIASHILLTTEKSCSSE